VKASGIEERQASVGLEDQQGDFGTAQDHALGALVRQALDDFDVAGALRGRLFAVTG
jgi:hypothetical protein